jgi:hypothetical protein
MWCAYGIHVSRGIPTVSVPHPIAPGKTLYFLADVPHAIKNLKEALVKGDIVYGEKIISINPIAHLIRLDQKRDIKLAPKLKNSDIAGGHFSKMKVSSAMHVFSNSVAAGLKFMVENSLIRETSSLQALDTAWFISLMNQWFDIMSSRSIKMALSKSDISAYNNARALLQHVITIFSDLSIGDGRWKPVQSAIIMSTSSVLALSDDILSGNLDFLMTSRLTQDCLENLFSSIRVKSPAPSPVEFRNSLKIVTVAQFLKAATTSSYDVDESEYLVNYLEPCPKPDSDTALAECPEEVVLIDTYDLQALDVVDLNSLYYLVGWSLKAVTDCSTCVHSLSVETPEVELAHASQLTCAKEYKLSALRHPKKRLFDMFIDVERMFRSWRSALCEVDDVFKFVMSKIRPITLPFEHMFLACHTHDGKTKIITKFITLRIHIACSILTQEMSHMTAGFMGSKSMAMRHVVKKL